MTDGLRNDDKTEPARFEPGGPAGPGRPKGSRSRIARALDTIAAQDTEEVLKTVLGLAKNGDLQAARLVLDRTWPIAKGRYVDADLKTLSNANDLPVALAQIIQSVGDGELTPEEGASVGSLVENFRKSIELVDIEQRLSKLEQKP
jgi:hypothetical protein